MKDSEHLQWIHDRIVNVYGENQNIDFLIRLRQIITKLEKAETTGIVEELATEYKGVHQPQVDNTTTPLAKKPIYYNPETKKLDTLFNEENLVPSWSVGYSNPNKGNVGEAVYIRISASDEQEAKTQALACQDFTKHILPEHFDSRYLTAFRTVGNFKLGEVEYIEGDPRL